MDDPTDTQPPVIPADPPTADQAPPADPPAPDPAVEAVTVDAPVDDLVYRDAASGETVDAEYAAEHPHTTYTVAAEPVGASNPVVDYYEAYPEEAPAVAVDG